MMDERHLLLAIIFAIMLENLREPDSERCRASWKS